MTYRVPCCSLPLLQKIVTSRLPLLHQALLILELVKESVKSLKIRPIISNFELQSKLCSSYTSMTVILEYRRQLPVPQLAMQAERHEPLLHIGFCQELCAVAWKDYKCVPSPHIQTGKPKYQGLHRWSLYYWRSLKYRIVANHSST